MMLLSKILNFRDKFNLLSRESEKILLNLGRIQSAAFSLKANVKSLHEVEFGIFSQNGEDGIIQYLISKMEITDKTFIEFGVEDYTESNTRFLLQNNNWEGLVIDGDERNIRKIKRDSISSKYGLTAERHFITRENINDILAPFCKSPDIGLLSIDIDGNDYWVWEAITVVKPRIVIIEYNSLFGDELKLSVPYDPVFSRTTKHYSNLYFGASLAALCDLAEKKGYDFIGSNSVGVNAFFIRKDLSAPFKTLTAKEGYVKIKSSQSTDEAGNLTFIRGARQIEILAELGLYDFDKGSNCLIKDLRISF